MIRTLFLGKHTGGNNHCLGIDALKSLLNNEHFEVVGCITTQKDLLYDFCIKNKINVANNVKSCYNIRDIDLAISYGFSKLIKENLINKCRIGCINFHPAPLPEWRGMGGVFNFAIYEKESRWGVTSHYVDNKFDTGDIIKKNSITLRDEDYSISSLTKRSHTEMLKLFHETMNIVVKCELENIVVPRKKQEKGRYISTKDFEELRRINKNDSSDIIDKKIKSFFHPPYHGAYIMLDGKEYTLLNSEMLNKIEIKDH